MKLFEMLDTQENPYYDGEQDKSPLKHGDTRKSKLTLDRVSYLI